ncbi:metalloregulator ArsR/SmtB family transcription factor [Kocuria sp. p3-SID1433]|uniref:ArsR/SmtB family transcription factor n=1 Tax=unclassified Kocuria TaxID=2649579 RepID=UPI0021A919B9|nr:MULTISPECIES: metalloregulator ArsR/SmtB family transcription factor [unclassified Kocuria]MCT1602817.1 metalloregulator ArsR/SmtB family transcription factor [Kocuria sp. p3-SID1428]MCT2180794.1 metalloregulator ArsR/SmtB family transcription factor [Kocuria sp. p3-SID1433]
MSTATLTHTSVLSRLGHALSDDTRTRILLALREAPARPSELAGALGVSKQVMSNQLACLRGCGLVTATAEGRNVWYVLAEPRLGQALGDLLELTLTLDPDCCSAEGCTCT